MACEKEIEQVDVTRYTINVSLNKYTLTVTPAKYYLTCYNGQYAKTSQVWVWNEEPIVVPVAVSIVTNDLFKKTISPIIFIDGVPYSWAKLGIVQDKEAGTLDFTDCTISSEIQGDIFLQYKLS